MLRSKTINLPIFTKFEVDKHYFLYIFPYTELHPDRKKKLENGAKISLTPVIDS